MPRPRALRGRSIQGEHPNWQPLHDLVGEPVIGDFMWMFEVELIDGSSLHAYKHIDTRRYIHLNSRGAAFAYEPPDRYRPVDAGEQLSLVFAILPGLGGVTDEQVEASRQAVERLGVFDDDRCW